MNCKWEIELDNLYAIGSKKMIARKTIIYFFMFTD